jgi:hypothetical protein
MSDINEKAIAVIEKEFSPALAAAGKIKVTNEKQKEEAGTLLTQLNKYNDALETEKKKATDPLNASLKTIRGWFKPRQEKVEAAIGNLREAIGSYQTLADRRAREEEAKIAARVGEGKGKFKAETAVRKMDEIEKPAEHLEVAGGTVKFRTDKVLRIHNAEKLKSELIAKKLGELLELDESAIKAFLLKGNTLENGYIEEVKTVVNSR